jgi:hypothetical protein
MQRELASRVGQTVMVKYRIERSLAWMQHLQVYELRIDNGALWTVAETTAHQRSTRWLVLPLTLLAAGSGMALAWWGLQSLRLVRSQTG